MLTDWSGLPQSVNVLNNQSMTMLDTAAASGAGGRTQCNEAAGDDLLPLNALAELM